MRIQTKAIFELAKEKGIETSIDLVSENSDRGDETFDLGSKRDLGEDL